MSETDTKQAILRVLSGQHSGLGMTELDLELRKSGVEVPQRTLRRWLGNWVDQGEVDRYGRNKGTRYSLPQARQTTPAPQFLGQIDPALRPHVLNQLRDFWTHSSTAIEGNTLSLGDTRAVLEYGLTVSGKPLREHQEILGHARAIDLLYAMTSKAVVEDDLFQLHAAVQTVVVTDSLRPIGAWKLETNYSSSMTSAGDAVVIEYARPQHVPMLIAELLESLNPAAAIADQVDLDIAAAIKRYARIHVGFVHVHPFFDGNGRLSRLLSNLPLLRAGYPPLLIDQQERRRYIELLADYQSTLGPPTPDRGLWPQPELLEPFEAFCQDAFEATRARLSLPL